MIITSKDNEIIKQIRKLKDKKYRDMNEQYLIEGINLINEAIVEKTEINTIIVCEDCVEEGKLDKKLLYEIAKYNCVYVNKKVFDSISDVQNPQGIMAVISKKEKSKEINYNEDIIIILDNIQDPGNLGTILRTIDSIGLSQIIVSNKTTDAFNSKVVRATMGAIFRINIIESEDLTRTIKEIKKHKIKIYATSLQESNSIYDVEYNKVAIVIGNEANGVSQEILDLSDKKIKIPMIGKTESLNAAVATSIVLYEYLRQKIKPE